jgi:hypothetical protein
MAGTSGSRRQASAHRGGELAPQGANPLLDEAGNLGSAYPDRHREACGARVAILEPAELLLLGKVVSVGRERSWPAKVGFKRTETSGKGQQRARQHLGRRR